MVNHERGLLVRGVEMNVRDVREDERLVFELNHIHRLALSHLETRYMLSFPKNNLLESALKYLLKKRSRARSTLTFGGALQGFGNRWVEESDRRWPSKEAAALTKAWLILQPDEPVTTG